MIRTSSVSRNFLRLGALLIGGLFLALLSGCKVFNLSGPQSTMVTEGPVAKAQWDLFMVTVYVTTFIFVVVGAVLVGVRSGRVGADHVFGAVGQVVAIGVSISGKKRCGRYGGLGTGRAADEIRGTASKRLRVHVDHGVQGVRPKNQRVKNALRTQPSHLFKAGFKINDAIVVRACRKVPASKHRGNDS